MMDGWTVQDREMTYSSVSNHTFILARSGEYNSVSPRASSRVDFVAVEDGEFVVRSRIREIEALVIVVLVRILITAHSLAILIVAVTLFHGSIDI